MHYLPNAPLIPTKKGTWDFAKNLQVAVTDDNIIIGSIFINNPDDSKALPQILPELKKNFEILWELQKKYGIRNNEKQIKNMQKKPCSFAIQVMHQKQTSHTSVKMT